jgi:dolichol-phosphate mannosyltransferase
LTIPTDTGITEHYVRASRTAVVIIPTSNEARSIGILLDALIGRVFLATTWDCHALVVDANSPDGTADVVREKQKHSGKVHLIVEQQKEGLGAAYFKGFRHAVESLSADAVVEFDGDLQHPPDSIPVLLAALDQGADLVLGSRRRPGGSYPRGWSFVRRFLSEVGGFVSRFLLFFPLNAFWQVTDPTTGLKATRVDDRFRSLDFDSFLGRGFGYKLEMLFRLVQAGSRIKEVPLQFRLREAGESKMEGQAPWDILRTCMVLRFRHEGTRRFFKFALVGLSGYIVNGVLLEVFSRMAFIRALAENFTFFRSTVLAFLSQQSGWASVLSVEGSILSNFLWNNVWTFRGTRTQTRGKTVRRLLGFNLTSVGAILIQAVAVGSATRLLGDSTLVRQISLIATIGLLVLPYNWLMYNRLIWRKP